MRLGSIILVIDLRPDCCIGHYLCETLSELGFCVRCLKIRPGVGAARGADRRGSDNFVPNNKKNASCDIEFHYLELVIPSAKRTSWFYRVDNDDERATLMLKEALVPLCRQISRVFIIINVLSITSPEHCWCCKIVSQTERPRQTNTIMTLCVKPHSHTSIHHVY